MKALFLSIILFASSSFAFNGANHRFITEKAIKILNEKYGVDFISVEEAEQVINGNLSEDRFGFKWLLRPFSQHYYNPAKSEDVRRKHKSANHRFERLAQRLHNREDQKRFFHSLGEILHYIQDMSNPAHVVPVYHGGCCMVDRFDHLDLSGITISSTPELTGNPSFSSPYLKSILAPPALRTLDRLQSEFEIERIDPSRGSERIIINWNYFWESNDDTWFGEYGSLGYPNGKRGRHVDNFLENVIRRGELIYHIDEKVYNELIEDQISAAIYHSAQFLYYAKTRLLNSEASQE